VRKRADVRGHLPQAPGVLGRAIGATVTPLIDQDHPILVGQSVEVVAERVVVYARSPVENQQGIATTTLDDVEARIPDVYVVSTSFSIACRNRPSPPLVAPWRHSGTCVRFTPRAVRMLSQEPRTDDPINPLIGVATLTFIFAIIMLIGGVGAVLQALRMRRGAVAAQQPRRVR
jgi:hypothetical protein